MRSLLIMLSAFISISEATASEATAYDGSIDYYLKAYQTRRYYINGETLIAGTNAQVQVKSVEGNAPDKLDEINEKLSIMADVSQVSCQTPPSGLACLVAWYEDGLDINITLIWRSGGIWYEQDLPGQYVDQVQYLLSIGDDSWIIARFDTATIYQVSVIGDDVSQETFLDFDETIYFPELKPIDGGAVVIKHQVDTYLNDDRSEDAWYWFDETLNIAHRVEEPPLNCLLVASPASRPICSGYDDDVAVLREVTGDRSQTSATRTLARLGDKGAPTGVFSIKNGLLLNSAERGYKRVFYLPTNGIMAGQPVVCAVPGTGESVNHWIFSANSRSDRFLVDIDGPLNPYSQRLISVTVQDGICTFATIENVAERQTIYDANSVSVTERVSERRGVPYTELSARNARGKFTGTAILAFYGAYNSTFPPRYLGLGGKTYLEGGGKWIFAHIRGSAGFGQKWRAEGTGIKKKAAIKDVISIARELVKNNAAEEGRIFTWSSSAGGVVAASSVLQEQKLFGGAILLSPCLLLPRNGRAYCTGSNEFGNPTLAYDFSVMRSFFPGDIYARVQQTPPTLIFQHRGDPLLPISLTRQYRELGPEYAPIEVITFEGNGHGLPNTPADGRLYNETWLEFIERHAPARVQNPSSP